MRHLLNIFESIAWPDRITPDQLINWMAQHHHTPEDIGEGDLSDRVWSFEYYTLRAVAIDDLDLEQWGVFDHLVADYTTELANGDAPPIVYDPVNHSIIDGTHRANARKAAGFDHILAYVGDGSYTEPDHDDE